MLNRLRILAATLRASWTPGLTLVQARLLGPYYRATFLAAAGRSGLLRALADGPLDAPAVARALGADARPELVAPWLDIGVGVGVLDRAAADGVDRYGLRGLDARLLARDRSGVATAGLLESVYFHQQAILNAPRFAVEGGALHLEDQDPAIIARSTRMLQPMIEDTVREVLRTRRPRTWLEVGAGDGDYAVYAARLAPSLRVTCLEAQKDLVDAMDERFAAMPQADRLRAAYGDIRDPLDESIGDERFDVVTLHNLVYYFDDVDRAAVVERCRDLLRPGGTLLLTTTVPAPVTAVSALDLWFRCSDFGAALPDEDGVARLLTAGGFVDVRTRRPMPPMSLVAATATRPHDRGRERNDGERHDC